MQCVKEAILTSSNSTDPWTASISNYITGSILKVYKKSNVSCRHVQLFGDSNLIAADVVNPYLHIWPLNNQQPSLNQRLITPGIVSALSCTSDACYIVFAIGEKLFIYQTSTGKLLKSLSRHYQTVTCIVFNSDNSGFATGAEDGLVFIWCLTSLINSNNQAAPYHEFSDHNLPVKSIYLGNFGLMSRLVTVSLDRTARIYNASTGEPLITLISDVALTFVCMDARECNLFIGCSNGIIRQLNLRVPPRVIECHLSTSNSNVFKGHTTNITNLSVSIDCTTLLSGSSDGTLNLWNIPSRQIIRSITQKGAITTATFIPAYENFQVYNSKQKILIKSFQIPDKENGASDIVEIISNDDDSFLLNEETFLKTNIESNKFNNFCGGESTMKYKAEIEDLKKINLELYEYAIKYIVNTGK